MNLNSILQDIGVPAGCSIAIIFMSLLLVSLIKSSQKLTAKSTANITLLKISSISVFITYIIYIFIYVLSRYAIDIHACHIRMPLISVSWTFARATLYFFFVVRCQISFEGSEYAFSKCSIRGLQATIIFFYGTFGLFNIAIANHYAFDEDKLVCIPTAMMLSAMMSGFVILVDFILGIISVGLYAVRLWKLHKEINANNPITASKDCDFIGIAKKQCKLAFVSYISSVFFMYVAPFATFLMLPYVDALINVLCVYCTFTFTVNKKIYEYLCECNGNTYVRYFCCFCCCCCNAVIPNDEERKLAQMQNVDSNTKNHTQSTNTATTNDVVSTGMDSAVSATGVSV